MKISSKKIRDHSLAFALMFLIAGCHNYYMASSNKNNDTAKAIDSLTQQNNYFILRNGDHVFHMKDISISDDRKALNATLEKIIPGPANVCS